MYAYETEKFGLFYLETWNSASSCKLVGALNLSEEIIWIKDFFFLEVVHPSMQDGFCTSRLNAEKG